MKFGWYLLRLRFNVSHLGMVRHIVGPYTQNPKSDLRPKHLRNRRALVLLNRLL